MQLTEKLIRYTDHDFAHKKACFKAGFFGLGVALNFDSVFRGKVKHTV